MNRFNDKVVFVTGAASGIGRECSRLFAREGAQLVLTDLNKDALEELKEELVQNVGSVPQLFVGDITDESLISKIYHAIDSDHDTLDIAVNNAGIGGPYAPIENVSIDQYHKVMEVNTTAVFRGMQEQIKIMKKQGHGSIVNVSSMAGLIGSPYSSGYCASKHAVIGLTKAAAHEVARNGVRINAVCPSFVKTPLVDQLYDVDERIYNKLEKVSLFRRFGKVEEIADGIAYLASDQSSFTTGLALKIDGGLTA